MKRLLLLLPALLGLAGCHVIDQTVYAPAPPAVVAAPDGPVSLRIATFRNADQLDDNWFRITRDYPEIGQYPPRVKVYPVPDYSRIYELYVDGVPGAVAVRLCADMMAHDQFCSMQVAAAAAPTSTSVTSETTTIVAPAPVPPVGTTPLP